MKAEHVKKPSPELMLTEVYDEMPRNLREQRSQMKDHLQKYGEHYPLDNYEKFV